MCVRRLLLFNEFKQLFFFYFFGVFTFFWFLFLFVLFVILYFFRFFFFFSNPAAEIKRISINMIMDSRGHVTLAHVFHSPCLEEGNKIKAGEGKKYVNIIKKK